MEAVNVLSAKNEMAYARNYRKPADVAINKAAQEVCNLLHCRLPVCAQLPEPYLCLCNLHQQLHIRNRACHSNSHVKGKVENLPYVLTNNKVACCSPFVSTHNDAVPAHNSHCCSSSLKVILVLFHPVQHIKETTY